MDKICVVILSILLNGCINSEREDVVHGNSVDTVKTNSQKIVSNNGPRWSSLQEIPKKWLLLSRTDTANVIYSPCDGVNPSIEFKDSLIIIHWTHEISKHKLTSYSISDNGVSIQASGYIYDDELVRGEDSLSASIEFIDPDNLEVLWNCSMDWGTPELAMKKYRWIMIPEGEASSYSVIENPCPDGKIREIEFLPVEYK